MRPIINLCCFSLPPSLQVLGKGVGMEGGGGMEGTVEAEREEALPISPSPSPKPWKKQAPAPTRQPASPPEGPPGIGLCGLRLAGWSELQQFISCCISCPQIPAERPRRLSPRARGSISFPTRLPPPSYFFTFPTAKARKDVGSREGFPVKKCSFSLCSVRIQLMM